MQVFARQFVVDSINHTLKIPSYPHRRKTCVSWLLMPQIPEKKEFTHSLLPPTISRVRGAFWHLYKIRTLNMHSQAWTTVSRNQIYQPGWSKFWTLSLQLHELSIDMSSLGGGLPRLKSMTSGESFLMESTARFPSPMSSSLRTLALI